MRKLNGVRRTGCSVLREKNCSIGGEVAAAVAVAVAAAAAAAAAAAVGVGEVYSEYAEYSDTLLAALLIELCVLESPSECDSSSLTWLKFMSVSCQGLEKNRGISQNKRSLAKFSEVFKIL